MLVAIHKIYSAKGSGFSPWWGPFGRSLQVRVGRVNLCIAIGFYFPHWRVKFSWAKDREFWNWCLDLGPVEASLLIRKKGYF